MNAKILTAIWKREESGVDIAIENRVTRSYISKIKGCVARLKYPLVADEQGVLCTSCHDRVDQLSFLTIQATGQLIAAVCSKCKHRLGQSTSLPGEKVITTSEPSNASTLKKALKFLNDFFKENAEYLFANPKIANSVRINASSFEEVEQLSS